MAEKRRGLGRGFDSLIPTQVVEAEFDVTAKHDVDDGKPSGDVIREVACELVDPNPHQPRKDFNEVELQALAASIRVHGILQPLIVTRQADRFELIAGERRLRAARIAGLSTVPVIVRSIGEQQKLELALLENIQRAELNPIELATAYRKLIDQFNMTLEKLGQKIGRDVSTISNTTRLLNLPLEAKRALIEGKITEGHARVILSVTGEPEKQLHLLKLIISKNWNVRQTEEYARAYKGETGSKAKAELRIKAFNNLTRDLTEFLGTKVSQTHTAKGGKLVIEFYSEEELDRIYRRIRGEL